MFWDEHEDKMQRRADILFPTMKDKKEKEKEKENIKKTIGLAYQGLILIKKTMKI